MEHDYTALLWEESGDIANFLTEAEDADFDQASLCEGWRVRDVMSHMIVGHSTPLPQMMGAIAKHRFNVPRGSREMSIDYGSSHSPDEIRAAWSGVVDERMTRGISRLISKKEALVDHMIHHQDMRRPLGRPREIPQQRLEASLDAMPTIGGFLGSKKRMRGLRWQATDMDWSWGEGPSVEGPAEALMLAASGRSSALDDLSGDGVATLRSRIGSG